MKEKIFSLLEEFNKETHGRTDYDKDEVFVMSEDSKSFAPLSFLQKNDAEIEGPHSLQKFGFIFSSHSFLENENFDRWYEHQFAKKLTSRFSQSISLLHWPDHKSIFDSVEGVNKCYEFLRRHLILVNGKNLPVQLGEWLGKVIFGLKQVKSTSQRGFDFHLDGKLVEVKVHWADQSSPKGVKIRKSLLDLSDHTIIIYLSRNFLIRDICFLDSDYVRRKFASKGHILFLKDADVSQYFFSKSSKHYQKVVNKTALMKFSRPDFVMKIMGRMEEDHITIPGNEDV